MSASAQRATSNFHRAESIPNGSTLEVKATVTAVTVQGEATFTSDQIHRWTYAQLRQTTQAAIHGFSLLRITSVLQPGAKVRVDAKILHAGEVIRHRFWELDGGSDGRTIAHGLAIDAGGN